MTVKLGRGDRVSSCDFLEVCVCVCVGLDFVEQSEWLFHGSCGADPHSIPLHGFNFTPSYNVMMVAGVLVSSTHKLIILPHNWCMYTNWQNLIYIDK